MSGICIHCNREIALGHLRVVAEDGVSHMHCHKRHTQQLVFEALHIPQLAEWLKNKLSQTTHPQNLG